MKKEKKLVIVGDGEFAEIAYEYFTRDSIYEVVAFCVETEFLKKDSLFELPVMDFNEVENKFPPNEHEIFVAITFTKLNRVRARLYQAAKLKGYNIASYISSRAFVWHNVKIGENCFIFENNVVQYNAKIGNNVVLWSGNHIGHRAEIEDNCFISSHVVVSGYCKIGANSFIGVNSTFADNVTIGKDCLVGTASVITKNLDNCVITKGASSAIANVTSLQYFGIEK
jgi:sugar O-acyltransferase (sialic acid O-acetyltransferase NeuD family)